MVEKRWTIEGHVSGMLDRDGRTIKLTQIDEHVVTSPIHEGFPLKDRQTATKPDRELSHQAVPGRTKSHSSCKTRKNEHLWKILQRLKRVLIVAFYLHLITFPCSTFSAPITRRPLNMSRKDSHPKWINPCGIRMDNGAVHDASSDVKPIADADLLTQIVDQANIAYSKAKFFKEDFAQKTFDMNPDQLHDLWKDNHYSWLPSTDEIPKELGQAVPKDHLEGLAIDTALLKTYEYLQKIAVGLEQVVWDEEDNEGPFESSFKEAEHNLRNLLCELQMTIYERNLKMGPDVQRDIMTEEFRDMDNTSTNIRNWLIYRDYMNVLEYVIEVFKYLKEKL